VRHATYYLKNRYVVTVHCVADLTSPALSAMQEWLQKQVGFLQKTDGPPLFSEAQERAFAEALKVMDRPKKLPEVMITAEFCKLFPASCELTREQHGEHEMHIFFDNGEQVGCWSVYGCGDQEGETLTDDDAAEIRSRLIDKLANA
jgi:hypothetical protein